MKTKTSPELLLDFKNILGYRNGLRYCRTPRQYSK